MSLANSISQNNVWQSVPWTINQCNELSDRLSEFQTKENWNLILETDSNKQSRNKRSYKKKKKKKKPVKKDMPVVFLPKPSKADCADSSGMSAFGFMSFALAMVNGVLNNANNINNNNNNNNNNDNNNNNNLVNINVANANNAAGNENEAMAGRRRRLKPLEELKRIRNMFANKTKEVPPDPAVLVKQKMPETSVNIDKAALVLPGSEGYAVKRIRIGYVGEEDSTRAENQREAFTVPKPKETEDEFSNMKMDLVSKIQSEVESLIPPMQEAYTTMTGTLWDKLQSFLSEKNRRRRSSRAREPSDESNELSDFEAVEEEAALTALAFIDMFFRSVRQSDAKCLAKSFCEIGRTVKRLGKLALVMGTRLQGAAAELLVTHSGISPQFLMKIYDYGVGEGQCQNLFPSVNSIC